MILALLCLKRWLILVVLHSLTHYPITSCLLIFFSRQDSSRKHLLIIFSSIPLNSNHNGNLLYEISYHLIQFLLIDNLFSRNTLRKVDMYKRVMSQFNDNEFDELVIQGFDWHEICHLERNDPNHSLMRFFETMNYYLDEMAPLIKMTNKERELMFEPWISPDLLRKCKQRD